MIKTLRYSALAAVAAIAIALVPAPGIAAGPDGKTLVTKSDCLACHAINHGDAKKVGPNYADVAAKYAGQPKAADMLAGSIKKGVSGHWGPIPMPPHPQLSDADAKAMASWVLSLKGKPAAKPGSKPAAKPAKK